MGRPKVATLLAAAAFVLAGCPDENAKHARKMIRQKHIPALKQVLREDVERHRKGIRTAAEQLADGFAVEDGKKREQQMRSALKKVQDPTSPASMRIEPLVISPMSFLAAIGSDGKVIARDAKPDRMKGKDYAKRFDVVRGALEGEGGYALGEFKADDGSRDVSMLFAAPVRRDGKVEGAVLAGIPLWRMAQRLSKQLRHEHADKLGKGLVLWAYLYEGDDVFHHGTPPEVNEVVPDAAAREKGLKESPDGFTGKVRLHGRIYGYGVAPVELLGDEGGVIVFRADARE
jgi:hypothetical protein